MAIETLGFDHIDLTVNDVARSQPFYEKVLAELGFGRAPDAGQSVIFHNGITSLAIRPAREEVQGAEFDRYRVGLHHLAFRAARRRDVDAFHRFLVDEGLPVLDAPAEYPEYGPDYYAVFFPDPDGLKLELAHFPWGYWRRVMTEGADARPRYPRGRPRSQNP
ncbi:MAG: VOC family protein [Myxococcales bacterium]|nr:VOC family protein [Myxococcales bacterium]